MSYLFFFSHQPSKYDTTLCTKPWVYSNWYLCQHTNDGMTYCCVEQEMMHRKALLFNDASTATKIMNTSDPGKLKAYGRQVKNFNGQVWDANKYNIVYKACKAKFEQNDELRQALLSTSGVLVEASPYDRVWGIGFSAADALTNLERWGENLLGKALTQVRDELQ